MGRPIFEEGPDQNVSGAKEKLVKQARQLAYDTKYKVKQQLGSGTKMNPAEIARAYMTQLSKSPAPPVVKAQAKKILMGESYFFDLNEKVKDSLYNVLCKVFIEGTDSTEQDDKIVEETSEKKYYVRVTDKKTGNTYRRWATRSKISELRSNPNISSVEMTNYGTEDDKEKLKGEKTAAVKSGKGLDPVGREDKDIDNDGDHDKTDKYLLNRRKKIGSAIANRGKKLREDYIVEKEDSKEKNTNDKKITGKNVNNKKYIKLNPTIGEASVLYKDKKISHSSDTSQQNQSQQRVQVSALQRLKAKQDQLNREKLNLQKQGKLPVGSVQMDSFTPDSEIVDEKLNLKTAPMGDVIKDFQKSDAPQFSGKTKEERRQMAIAAKLTAERGGKKLGEEACGCEKEEEPKLKKKEGGVEDPREIPTKVNLVKNKFRSMGLKMSYDLEGDMIEEGRDEDAQERRFQKRGERSRGETATRLIGTATRAQDTLKKRQKKTKPEHPTHAKLQSRVQRMSGRIEKLQKAREDDTSTFRQGSVGSPKP